MTTFKAGDLIRLTTDIPNECISKGDCVTVVWASSTTVIFDEDIGYSWDARLFEQVEPAQAQLA